MMIAFRLSRQYTPAEILALPQEELDKPVTLGDFEEAIADTKASVAQVISSDLQKQSELLVLFRRK